MALTLLGTVRMTVALSPRRATLLFAVALLFGGSAYFAGCGGDDSNGNGPGADGGTPDATIVDGSGNGDTGNNHGDGGANGDGACTPATGCPSDYKCGRYIDPCTGKPFLCGNCAATVCDAVLHVCETEMTACMKAGATCGLIKTACGTSFSCGDCPMGQQCVGGACKPFTPSDAGGCSSGTLSCTLPDGTKLCGTVSDGCGHSMNCTCAAPSVCGGNGVAGQCGLAPECEDGGACGVFPNGCGDGVLNCGGCTAGNVCSGHTCSPACTPTNPNPCQGLMCGSASDGCKQVKCGTDCTAPTECFMGQCCTPQTCAAFPDAGCDPIPDNCGGKLTCQMCGNSDRCVGGSCMPCPTCSDGGVCEYEGPDAGLSCCYAGTCADFPDAGCQPVNLGCGKQQICSTCAGSQVCQGDGTCCTPKTCADIPNPGCQPVALGCGKTQVCATCPGNEVCLANGTCCVPASCNGRTGIFPDGCGGQIVCNGTK